jgi:hypothetical protein
MTRKTFLPISSAESEAITHRGQGIIQVIINITRYTNEFMKPKDRILVRLGTELHYRFDRHGES